VTKLLFFIKSVFKTFTLDKLNDGLVVNTEAWRLYQFNRSVFAKLAAQCATVSASTSALYGRTKAVTEGEIPAGGQQARRMIGIAFRNLSESEVREARAFIFED
jgi:hypothetical protein